MQTSNIGGHKLDLKVFNLKNSKKSIYDGIMEFILKNVSLTFLEIS